jgi:hypothetical protein
LLLFLFSFISLQTLLQDSDSELQQITIVNSYHRLILSANMHFTTIFALAVAFSGVIAAPMPQDGTVTIAGGNRNNRSNTSTTSTTRPPTTTTTTTTVRPPTPTTTTDVVPPPPTFTGLPKCKDGRLTFTIKARSLQDASGNVLKSSADGQFIVDVGGPAGFSPNPTTMYTLSGGNEGFITQFGAGGQIATVVTDPNGKPHEGNIIFQTPDASIASANSPLRCTGAFDGRLACVAKHGNRKVAQVCGKFINFQENRNGNCQDELAFDVVRTCEF